MMAICKNVGIDKRVFYETVFASSTTTVSGLFCEVGRSIVNKSYNTPPFTEELLMKDAKLGLKITKGSDAPSVIVGIV